jgi:hypothetical protein
MSLFLLKKCSLLRLPREAESSHFAGQRGEMSRNRGIRDGAGPTAIVVREAGRRLDRLPFFPFGDHARR